MLTTLMPALQAFSITPLTRGLGRRIDRDRVDALEDQFGDLAVLLRDRPSPLSMM